jgi:hypothetical protein
MKTLIRNITKFCNYIQNNTNKNSENVENRKVKENKNFNLQ